MKNWSILLRIIVLRVVVFFICAAINVFMIRSNVTSEFIDQALEGNHSITMNMASQMVNGVRFKKKVF